MLPTWSRSVRDFLPAVGAGEPCGLMFGRDGGVAALVIFGQVSRQRSEPVQRFVEPVDRQTPWRGIAALPRALPTLGRCEAIPSIVAGRNVVGVSVSVALPALAVDRAGLTH